MYQILSPVDTEILIPETVEENGSTFGIDELHAAGAYYEENGYVVIRNAVGASVCDDLRTRFADTVKKYDGYIYRQATANPEKNEFSEFGYMMNPILNLQSLKAGKFEPLQSLATKVFGSAPIKQFCNEIFSEDPKLVQSMYFEGNSATWPHQDTYYLDSASIGVMVAGWYALEDIDAGAGRFFVMPGSHRIDMVRNGKEFDVAFNHQRYIELVKKIILDDKLEFRAPFLKKGDVLFWNSKTIHGSLRTTRPQFSRSSLTAHYIPVSHQFLQFQSIIKPLKLKEFEGMPFHCPKDQNILQNRMVLGIETTFPKTFQKVKKFAIKAMVR